MHSPIQIDLASLLQILQILVVLLGFGGMAFSLGRVFQIVRGLEDSHTIIRNALFGEDQKGGAFQTKEAAALMLAVSKSEHEAFDRRLNEFHERLGALSK